MDFVYPYVSSPTRELELSIRSVRLFVPDARIFVIGDNPRIEGVEVIRTHRQPDAHTDTLSKLKQALNSPAIGSDFVWMHDDVFILRPLEADELKRSRAYPAKTVEDLESWKPGNRWLSLKKATLRELVKRALPTYDYATHLPHWVEKSKLDILFREYRFSPMLLWELVYGNRFREKPTTSLAPWFYRWTRAQSLAAFQARIDRATIGNAGAYGWDSVTDSVIASIVGAPQLDEVIQARVKRPTVLKVVRRG